MLSERKMEPRILKEFDVVAPTLEIAFRLAIEALEQDDEIYPVDDIPQSGTLRLRYPFQEVRWHSDYEQPLTWRFAWCENV